MQYFGKLFWQLTGLISIVAVLSWLAGRSYGLSHGTANLEGSLAGAGAWLALGSFAWIVYALWKRVTADGENVSPREGLKIAGGRLILATAVFAVLMSIAKDQNTVTFGFELAMVVVVLACIAKLTATPAPPQPKKSKKQKKAKAEPSRQKDEEDSTESSHPQRDEKGTASLERMMG